MTQTTMLTDILVKMDKLQAHGRTVVEIQGPYCVIAREVAGPGINSLSKFSNLIVGKLFGIPLRDCEHVAVIAE